MALVPHRDSTQERYREISGKTYILTLLQRLVHQRLFVSISFSGSKEHFTSTVLSIEPHAGYFLLDQVFPQRGQQLLQQTDRLHLYANLGGAALGFTSSVLAQENVNGLVYYQVSLPETVNYLQRRDGHRVPVAALEIPVELIDHQGKSCKGMLHDISPSGIGIQLNEPGTFTEREIYRFGIYPPNEEPIHAELELCCHRQGTDGATPIMGGSFVSLDKRIEHNLGRLVAEFERRLLRARWSPRAMPYSKNEMK